VEGEPVETIEEEVLSDDVVTITRIRPASKRKEKILDTKLDLKMGSGRMASLDPLPTEWTRIKVAQSWGVALDEVARQVLGKVTPEGRLRATEWFADALTK